MEFKTGTYTSITTWETQTWNEKKLSWRGNHLVEQWSFQTNWKPVPFNAAGPSWEPVFPAALAGDFVYVPGAGGTVYKLNKSDGSVAAQYNPFDPGLANGMFLTGPITADSSGNIYFDTIKLNMSNPWGNDVSNSWLVKITASGAISLAQFKNIMVGELGPNDPCEVGLSTPPPWPPTPTSVAPDTNSLPSGRVLDDSTSSPVVAPDGSVFYGSYSRYNYAQGHLLRFSSTGQFLNSYIFGWDDTPAIRTHGSTYSIVTKDNHYGGVGSYCTA